MGMREIYAKVPFELSGAMSKNRFRQELCWGISKMFDLFDKDDFCVVFDYKCDIEVHFESAIDFYQIKTHKVQSPYNFSEIKRRKGGKQSVLAKLFVLKDAASDDIPIRCALVSNAFFQIGKTTESNVQAFCFSQLSDSDQKTVRDALADELSRKNIDLENLYYIYTSMDLFAPQDAVKGKIVDSFEKIKGCEPSKPNALYRLIYDTVSERACYELPAYDYDELVRRKGITKGELNQMLDRHLENTDNSVSLTYDFIEQERSVAKKRQLKMSLAKVLKDETVSCVLQDLHKKIIAHINTIPDDLSTEDMAKLLMDKFDESFTIEYNKTDRYIFIILTIKRWECGINE